jgi:hypothetical protein
MCLVRPGDCEFSPADGEGVLMFETPEKLTPDASAPFAGRGAPRASGGR